MIIKSPIWFSIANRAFLSLLVLLIPVQNTFSATPLQTHDLNPLVIIYGLPLASPARLPTQDQSFFSASLNTSNTINVEDNASENIFIDGETNELNLSYLFSFNESTRLRIRVPFISHNAGSLDSFIDDFHDTFGFPEGERGNYPNDQFLFSYSKDGTELLRVENANSGVGDINIDAAYQIYSTPSQSGSLWTNLKLPSGDDSLLTGSGGIDVSIWFAAEKTIKKDWQRYYNVGLLLTSNSGILSSLQKNEIIFGTTGIEWQATNHVTFNIQLDFHTAFYKTQTKFLGHSIQISSGGHIKLNNNQRIEIVVVEDLLVGASPDVTFQLGYSQTF